MFSGVIVLTVFIAKVNALYTKDVLNIIQTKSKETYFDKYPLKLVALSLDLGTLDLCMKT